MSKKNLVKSKPVEPVVEEINLDDLGVSELQMECHYIRNLAGRIQILLDNKQIFEEVDDDFRLRLFHIAKQIPGLRPTARALIHKLICLLYGKDYRFIPVSDRDIELYLEVAYEYEKILMEIYYQEAWLISAQPAEKRNGHFKSLFRQNVIKKSRIHHHPIVKAVLPVLRGR